MPMYEYKCARCGAEFEEILRITEKDEVACPECGAPAERQQSGCSVGGQTVAGRSNRCYTGG